MTEAATVLRKVLSKVIPGSVRRAAASARVARAVRHANWARRPPLLVYQMGKVGSTAVYEAFAQSDAPYSVYHVHWLSTRGLQESAAYYRGRGDAVPASLHESAAIRRRLDDDRSVPLRVLTLVRDPIRRQISDFFQGLGRWSPDCRDENGRTSGAIATRHIRERLLGLHADPRGPCTWFENEFRPALGVDVYAQPFNENAGFSVLTGDRVEVLVLRLEDLARCFDSVVGPFLSIEQTPRLAKANETSSRESGDAYRYVLEHLDVPDGVLRDIYSTKYARHFGYDAGGLAEPRSTPD